MVSDARQIDIYYTADSHGSFEALSRCSASFAQGGNALIIDGGDFLHGSPSAYWLSKVSEKHREIPAEIMNACGFQYVVPGNHEFSFGVPVLQDYLRTLNAKCLCANCSLPEFCSTELAVLPNGLKVGLTGICTPFDKALFTDAYEAAENAESALDALSPDVKICIYHGGFELEPEKYDPLNDVLSDSFMEENQALRIARDLHYDILLTAHQHHLYAGKDVCGTFICQTGVNCESYLKLTWAEKGGVTSAVIPQGTDENPAVSALTEKIRPELDAWLDSPLGKLNRELLPEERIHMAAKGTLIANFFNQVQIEASGADISCTALGNEIMGFSTVVTAREILSTYIYPNTLKLIRVTGKAVKAALERTAEYFAMDADGNLEVSKDFLSPMVQHFNYDFYSGIEYTIAPKKTKGERVQSLIWKGIPLADDTELTLALNDYRASGMGGYDVFTTCPVLWESPCEIAELILDYFGKHETVTVDERKYIYIE